MYKTLFLMACFMPYISPGIPMPTEVQPWAALMAWGAVVFGLVTTMRLRGDVWFAVMVFLSIVMMVYVYPEAEGGILTFLRKTFALLLSLGIIVYAAEVTPQAVARALRFAVPAWLAFALLQYASPQVFLAVVSPFVANRDLVIGERGAASLAPEATDFGFTSVYLLVIILLVRKVLASTEGGGKGFGRVLIPMAILNILLSKSASGVFASVLVLGVMNLGLLTRWRRLIPAGMAVVAVGAVAMLFPEGAFDGIRGFRVLSDFIAEPASILQTSFAHRAVHNIVGVIALVESGGTGHGAGSFTSVGPRIYVTEGLGHVLQLNDYHVDAVFRSLQTAALGVFPQLLTEYGVVGILLIVMVFWRVLASRMVLRYAVASLMFLTWLQSFPLAYPMFWLLVGFAGNRFFQAAPRGERQDEAGPSAVAAGRHG